MAFGCGIRVLVRRDASPLLHDYVARQGLCDYITAHPAERHAVREVCELLLGLLGSFDAVVASRVAMDPVYLGYFAARQSVKTQIIDRGAVLRAERDASASLSSPSGCSRHRLRARRSHGGPSAIASLATSRSRSFVPRRAPT